MNTDESTASFLDKTDWRKTIHRKLEASVDARGQFWYPHSIDSLIDAVSAEYPGFDAEAQIREKHDLLKSRYDELWELWLVLNSTKRKWQKYKYKRYLYHCFCHDLFTYVKNLCAKKRMLLWGSKKTPGGFELDSD